MLSRSAAVSHTHAVLSTCLRMNGAIQGMAQQAAYAPFSGNTGALLPCRQVLQIFDKKHWALIDGHLQDMLGRHAMHSGDAAAAAHYFTAALACKDVHPDRQQQLLDQLIQLTKQLSTEQVGSAPVGVQLCSTLFEACASAAGYLCRSLTWRPASPSLQ